MRDRVTLGATPYGEDCLQVGVMHYQKYARLECQRYVAQLTRQNPPPQGCRFVITSNPHDFGSYLEVEAEFDEDNDDQVEWAYALEGNPPEFWDEIAKAEIEALAAEPEPDTEQTLES